MGGNDRDDYSLALVLVGHIFKYNRYCKKTNISKL